MPRAEVGAVDGVHDPVRLAAADAQAMPGRRQRHAAFETEGAVVVDREAALDDDRRIAAARRVLARFVAQAHPGVAANADAPVGRESELERDRNALAYRAGLRVLVQVAALDFEPAGRRQRRRCRHARPVRNGARGIVGRECGDGRKRSHRDGDRHGSHRAARSPAIGVGAPRRVFTNIASPPPRRRGERP